MLKLFLTTELPELPRKIIKSNWSNGVEATVRIILGKEQKTFEAYYTSMALRTSPNQIGKMLRLTTLLRTLTHSHLQIVQLQPHFLNISLGCNFFSIVK